MKRSYVGLNDLPDEILLIILTKLSNFDVLYSFLGVNQRFNKIVRDPIFTSRLSLIQWLSNEFLSRFSSDLMRDEFCLQILPEIHHQIQWINLEFSSMTHVFHAIDYPYLHTLGLFNLNQDSVRCLSTDDEIRSSAIFKNQIRKLLLTIDKTNIDSNQIQLLMENLFNKIFTIFINLIDLTLLESSYQNRVRLSLHDSPSSTFCSSTLVKLNIAVQSFDDCLVILDGRFNQLQRLDIDLHEIHPLSDIQNQGEIPNLKRFSLSCEYATFFYDDSILPLLYRMSNLEQLGLYLSVDGTQRLIDQNELNQNIINRMPQLNQFVFHIRSQLLISNQMNWSTLMREHLPPTLIDFSDNGMIAYLDSFPKAGLCRYHIYSYPSVMEYYNDISNRFPGGLFQYVRVVSLYDEQPFQEEFFLRIHKSFPLLEKLSLCNINSQNLQQSNNDDDHRHLSVIQYSFLNELHLIHVHDDYIEQFLFHTKTCFHQKVFLCIRYQSLQRVTHNFTRDVTRINCAKINQLHLFGKSIGLKSLEQYFPLAKIHCSSTISSKITKEFN